MCAHNPRYHPASPPGGRRWGGALAERRLPLCPVRTGGLRPSLLGSREAVRSAAREGCSVGRRHVRFHRPDSLGWASPPTRLRPRLSSILGGRDYRGQFGGGIRDGALENRTPSHMPSALVSPADAFTPPRPVPEEQGTADTASSPWLFSGSVREWQRRCIRDGPNNGAGLEDRW